MGRLRAAMTSKYKERDEDVKIHTPRNLETLELSFRAEQVAKVCLTLASRLHNLISCRRLEHSQIQSLNPGTSSLGFSSLRITHIPSCIHAT